MSGVQIWNDAGALVIDSDYRHTTITNIYAPPPLIDVGAIGGQTPFGMWEELGFLHPNYYPTTNNLYWIRFRQPGWCFPGAWMFQPNSVDIMITSRVQPLASGYMDVYDVSGNLVWSAVSAGGMPRTRILQRITSAPTNAIAGITPGFNPWFLMGACPGNMSYSGEELVGYSGLVIRWTGAEFQWSWVQQYQWSFAEIFGTTGGMTIPLAQFTGY